MRHALVPFLVFVLATICQAEDRPHYDACEVKGVLRGAAHTSFILRIESAPISTNRISGISRWWGRDGSVPERVTSGLSFTLGGRVVTIPSRAFADLGEPNIPDGISLMEDADSLFIYVRGGDAGGSYIAKLIVRAGKLVRREVVPGEFPEFKPEVMRFD